MSVFFLCSRKYLVVIKYVFTINYFSNRHNNDYNCNISQSCKKLIFHKLSLHKKIQKAPNFNDIPSDKFIYK